MIIVIIVEIVLYIFPTVDVEIESIYKILVNNFYILLFLIEVIQVKIIINNELK